MADNSGKQSNLEKDAIRLRNEILIKNKYNVKEPYTTPDTSKNVGQVVI